MAALKQCDCWRRATSDCAKQAADGFAAEEPQMTGTRGEAENLFRPRRAQPLEIDRQLRVVEIARARARAGNGCAGRSGAGVSSCWNSFSVERAQPTVRRPKPFSESRFRGRACSARDCAAGGRTDRPCRFRRPASRRDRRGRRAAAATSGRCARAQDVRVRMQFVGAGQLCASAPSSRRGPSRCRLQR